MSVKIHILWVGSAFDELSPYAHFSKQNYWECFDFTAEPVILFSHVKKYFSEILTRDVAGFASFLEAVIKDRIKDIELYFHCFEAYKLNYENILQIFCEEFNKKHHSNAFEFTPKFHVVSFEESLKLFTIEDKEKAFLIQKYLNFVKDERVKNARHFDSCKVIFTFCILYLYGGYTFDGNVFVLPDNFQNIFHPSKKSLESFKHIPLINSFEQVCIFNAQNRQQQELRFVLKLDTEFYSVIQKPQTGLYLPRNSTNLFWTNLICSCFAQRCLPKTAELLVVIEFMTREIIAAIQKFYQIDTAISTEKAFLNINHYNMRSNGILNAAPFLPKIRHVADLIYPDAPLDSQHLKCYLEEKTRCMFDEHKIFISFIPEEREHSKQNLFSTLKLIPCDTYFFTNFPLVKFSYKSYHVKSEYYQKQPYLAECEAAAEYF